MVALAGLVGIEGASALELRVRAEAATMMVASVTDDDAPGAREMSGALAGADM